MRRKNQLDKFSKKIIFSIFLIAVIIIATGLYMLKKAYVFNEINTARKLIEAGFTLFPVSVLTAAIVKYLRTKTVS